MTTLHYYRPDDQIRALRTEAASAGDMLQVAYCEIALTGRTTGLPAIAYAEQHGLRLNKYADPTEGARGGVTIEDAHEIAAADAGLLWLTCSTIAARQQCAEALRDATPRGVILAIRDDWEGTPDMLGAIAEAYNVPEGAVTIDDEGDVCVGNCRWLSEYELRHLPRRLARLGYNTKAGL